MAPCPITRLLAREMSMTCNATEPRERFNHRGIALCCRILSITTVAVLCFLWTTPAECDVIHLTLAWRLGYSNGGIDRWNTA
jgi:hypothetical protein